MGSDARADLESAHITVCIATRDRGEAIASTLRSIAASTHADFDVVVVDQSETDETERAFDASVGDDPRFVYIRSHSKGLSAARNVALKYVQGPLIGFTDDDCEVAPNWLRRIAVQFDAHPEVGLIFGEVRPAPHDGEAGFVPDYRVQYHRVLRSPWLKWREHGIGANMACRLAVLRQVGPFDELLGAGAPFRSAEDDDMAYRVLRAGYSVLSTPDVCVTHTGFREWSAARALVRGAGTGLGATYMKHVRLGDLAALPALVAESVRAVNWGRLIRLQRANGLGYVLAYLRAIKDSLPYRIDHDRRIYEPGLEEVSERTPVQVPAAHVS